MLSPKLVICACLLIYLGRVNANWGWPSLPFFLNPSVIRGIEDFAQFVDKSQLPQRSFTWSEVAKGDGRDGRPLYIVLDNNVYDVNEFADLHAGGSHHIKNNAGKDVSKLMREASMPDYVFNGAIKMFSVGQIKDGDNNS